MNSTSSPPPSPELARGMPVWAKLLAAALLVILASVGFFNSSFLQKGELTKPNLLEVDSPDMVNRKTVADFVLKDMNGTEKHLSDFKGQVVLLSFWASWCAPCLVELPTFAELKGKFNDRGFEILPVNLDDGDEGRVFALEFWGKKKFPFPSFIDSQKEIAQRFQVEMLPSNFVLDRQGRIVFSGIGATDWMSQQTLDLLEGLLIEPASASEN